MLVEIEAEAIVVNSGNGKRAGKATRPKRRQIRRSGR
jgi:hypothetical protein